MEIWKDIPRYQGYYQVSNLGNVKSLSRFGSRKELILKHFLRGKNSRQYKCFKLYKNKKNKTYNASTLVAMSFLNHIPDGYNLVVDHIDNDNFNDKLDNLQIISNRFNTIKNRDRGSSDKLGVSWNKNAKKWRAYFRVNGKQKHLGYFKDEESAYKKYKEFLINNNIVIY